METGGGGRCLPQEGSLEGGRHMPPDLIAWEGREEGGAHSRRQGETWQLSLGRVDQYIWVILAVWAPGTRC